LRVEAINFSLVIGFGWGISSSRIFFGCDSPVGRRIGETARTELSARASVVEIKMAFFHQYRLK
jgi:hypothetical protein